MSWSVGVGTAAVGGGDSGAVRPGSGYQRRNSGNDTGDGSARGLVDSERLGFRAFAELTGVPPEYVSLIAVVAVNALMIVALAIVGAVAIAYVVRWC